MRIAGRTRVGIKITDPALYQTIDINFPGPAPAPDDLDALRERLATSSLPPGVNATISLRAPHQGQKHRRRG
jgi:1-phosphofructokinase